MEQRRISQKVWNGLAFATLFSGVVNNETVFSHFHDYIHEKGLKILGYMEYREYMDSDPLVAKYMGNFKRGEFDGCPKDTRPYIYFISRAISKKGWLRNVERLIPELEAEGILVANEEDSSCYLHVLVVAAINESIK